MKLQCSCGAKYAFDITPEMAQNPVKFVCPNCGLDASDYVNQLVRDELAARAAEQPLPDAPAPSVAAAPPPPARLRVSVGGKPAEAAVETPASSKFCNKHRERATEQCAICHKPICPKCMALFGYFCSPLCKGKAEAQNIDVPVYAGRKDLVEAKFWRKTGLVIGALVGLVVLFFGAWTWYAWRGSVPHPYFSVRFEDTERGYYGSAHLVGKDQLVYLHGGTLARCDLKDKKQIWSQELITKPQLDAAIKAANDDDARANEGSGFKSHRTQSDIERSAKQGLQAELMLRVSGQNIWVARAGKMAQYDWDSGKVLREVTLPERGGELIESGDELLMLGAQSVTHVSLASGESRVEKFGPPGAKTIALAQNDAGGGLPRAGVDGKPLDPQKVEAQVQNLNTPGRIALPALLGNAQHEQQLEAALKEDSKRPQKNSKSPPAGAELFRLVPGKDGFAQFSERLLEERMVTRSAMKAPAGKSVMDSGNVNGINETAAINETLNEMQRNNGGGSVTEDESRYQVTVRVTDASAPDWTSEVVGPPQLVVLKTVNVVAAGKTVIVLDKANKKVWQAALTYPVPAGGGGFFSREASQFGEGPCVEHGDTLYVFDQAVLTAFELNSGNARWRLPSVGVVGLFFDDQGNVYVNTTTGNPDDIKYSRQIDVTRKTEAVLFKVEPKTGKTLWSVKPGGYISYLSGKFIYTIESYDPNPGDEDVLNDMIASMQKPPYLRIARIRPSDGRLLWEYTQERAPIDARFHDNSIELVYKREVQVLRYFTF